MSPLCNNKFSYIKYKIAACVNYENDGCGFFKRQKPIKQILNLHVFTH